MNVIIWFLVIMAGALIGSLAGGLVTGYLVIFKSLEHIASVTDPAQWTKVLEGGIILLFTKSLVVVGAVTGGFFGAVPGIVGLSRLEELDE